MKRSAYDRMIEKTAQGDGCWPFLGARGGDGYGTVGVGSNYDGTRRTVSAHRVAYEYHFGPVPEGLELDHLCRNRACVNPDHLEAVTHRENTRRGDHTGGKKMAQIHRDKTHCPQGHPYSGDNLYVTPNGNRKCRTCHRERQRKVRERASKASQ